MKQQSLNNYYYGKEADQYTFYRIPKALFVEPEYQDLSSDAKILYSLLLDRMGISLRNEWLDEQNRVYVYFSQKEAQEVLSCGHNKANALFADLENAGLIKRKRQGLGRPDMIYVMKFSTEKKKEEIQPSLNEDSAVPERKHQPVLKGERNNTEKNKTEFNNTIYPSDETDEVDGLCELLRENIEYEILREQADMDVEMIDEIVNLLEDVLISRSKEIHIGSTSYPKSAVRNRILKLNSEHIKYVEMDKYIMTNFNDSHWTWNNDEIGAVEIDGNNYYVREAIYKGSDSRHTGGVLPAGEYTYNSLAQVYMKPEVTNEDCEAIDGNGNGTYDILVLSQAVQTAGFENAGVSTFAVNSPSAAEIALDTAFGAPEVMSENNVMNVVDWFAGLYIADYTLPAATVVDGIVTVPADETQVLSGSFYAPITVNGEGTLHLRGVSINADNGAALTIAEGAKLVIENAVSLKSEKGSAITGKVLDITGTPGAKLTAIANGDHAYGIGGDNTEEITINDLTIVEVKGGHAGEIGTDTKYYKDAPDGGAAIGSGYNGAVITLNKVTIANAKGGSKAAGIGAHFWTGVTININDSFIKNVEGGATAAGIGGSRVSSEQNENGTVIKIVNSTIDNAVGGVYGAGIGSGYDTHCQANQPICTINIEGSTINATGGQYAAGVGTGYHNAGLAGEIKNSTVKAVSGEKYYKDAYTKAQDIGFGVVDPAREAANNNSSITYNGVEIRIPAAGK